MNFGLTKMTVSSADCRIMSNDVNTIIQIYFNTYYTIIVYTSSITKLFIIIAKIFIIIAKKYL